MLPTAVPHHAPARVLSQLRAATRSRHGRIDGLMDLRRLREPGRYAAILRAFHAFLAVWEPAVAAALPAPWSAWLRARSRLGFLRRDLAVLGLDQEATDIALPPLRGAAAAWGSVYVLEGSALGGQVITRSLAEAGLHPHSGAAYFHGWGDATAAMWREFRAMLEHELSQPQALEQACEAACGTFDTLTHLLESSLHERAPAA